METLRSDVVLMSNARAKAGIEEMAILFTYLEAYGIIDKASRRSVVLGCPLIVTRVYRFHLISRSPVVLTTTLV